MGKWLIAALLAALVAISAIWLVVAIVDEDTVSGGVETDLGAESQITTDELAGSDDMFGERVRVSAAIDTVLSPQVFELRSNNGVVLALSTGEVEDDTGRAGNPLDVGDIAEANGPVRRFDEDLVRAEGFQWEAVFDRYRGEPVIVDQSVRVTSGPFEGGDLGA